MATEETSKVESPDNEEAVLFEDPQEDLIVMGTEVPSEGDSSASRTPRLQRIQAPLAQRSMRHLNQLLWFLLLRS